MRRLGGARPRFCQRLVKVQFMAPTHENDLSAYPPGVQLYVYVGRITGAGANLDDNMARVVAALASPEFPEAVFARRVAGAALRRRNQKLARKPWAAKLELLELLWPDLWADPGPFLQLLRKAGDARNRAAHSIGSPMINVFFEVAKDIDDEADLEQLAANLPWRSYNTRNQSSAIFDLDEAAKTLAFVDDLGSTAFDLMFWAASRRQLPLDAVRLYESVRDHPPGAPRTV